MGLWPFSTLIRDNAASAGIEEARDITNLDYITFADAYAAMRGGGNTAAGALVGEDTAMQLSVVYRCVQVNCETVSSLPVSAMVKRGEAREPYPDPFWLSSPNDEQDWDEFVMQGQYSYELDGNAFILKASTEQGKLVGLYVLDPTKVTPKRVEVAGRRALVYAVAGQDELLPANAVIHIKGMVPPGQLRGLSPIGQLREQFGTLAAAYGFGANFFGSGATLSGVIEAQGSITKEQADRIKDDFTKKHGGISKSHAIGVLSGGAQWKPLSVNPDEAQFISTIRLNSAQLAYVFGVPPHMVTDVEGAKGYVTGVMAGRMDWWQVGIQPRVLRWEKRMSRLLPRPAYIKFNERAFMRGDATEQSALMTAEIQNGVRSRDEWRAILDLPPVPGGDTYYMQGGTFALDGAGKPIGPKPPAPPGASPASATDEAADSGLFHGGSQQ